MRFHLSSQSTGQRLYGTVEALRFNGSNAEAFTSFPGVESVDVIGRSMSILARSSCVFVSQGQWVVYYPDGELIAVDDNYFNSNYRRA